MSVTCYIIDVVHSIVLRNNPLSNVHFLDELASDFRCAKTLSNTMRPMRQQCDNANILVMGHDCNLSRPRFVSSLLYFYSSV
jgi:hypothetical protein